MYDRNGSYEYHWENKTYKLYLTEFESNDKDQVKFEQLIYHNVSLHSLQFPSFLAK